MGALSASSSQFLCKSHPSVLCRLMVSSAPGGFQGHLRVSSDPRRVPSSCIILGVGCPLGASSSSTYKNSHSVVSSGCPHHQDDPRSSLFMHKKCPSVLHHLWVSSAPRAFPGHLHPPSQAVSLHRVSSLGIRGTWCPPGASACSFCQPPPSISHQPLILVFSALDALPGHL